MTRRYLPVVLLIWLLPTSLARAQVGGGALTGSVTNQADAAVPGAAVSATALRDESHPGDGCGR